MLKHLNSDSSFTDLESSLNLLNQYKAIIDESSIVSKTDAKGIITYVNDAFCKTSGYEREELLGYSHNKIRHPDNEKAIYKEMWSQIKDKKIWKGTIKNLAKSGEEYYVKSVIMPILDNKNSIVEYIAARTDVTELIKKDKIIKKQYTDELTGLKNRTALISDLSQKDEEATLVLINIDRFSDINDYFGYSVGDKVLQEMAKKIKRFFPKDAEFYRISGDEFAVLCGDVEVGPKQNENIKKLISNLEKGKYEIQNYNISLILSCGVAHGKKSEIYKLSHIAIKERIRTNQKVVFYNENLALHDQTKKNIEVIDSIKSAIDEDRFIPFYQGIVDNKTRKIVKYEALIRLKEKDGQIISPFFFLEHSKKAKLYNELTKVMIEKSFKKFADLKYKFSINLCLQDIECDQTKQVLIENLEKYKCGNRLILEIVESEGIENFKELSLFIKEMKKYGCKIAIDDFGTGYSNFSYLTKLDIDYIKIDGSLVNKIDTDITQRITVESILLFAKKMNIKTVAEFVENESIYNTLNELGVDFSQGYLFSKPSEEL